MKQKQILRLLFGFSLILLLNLLASYYFLRIDLTEEKRYTITPATRNILKQLDDQVYIKIYLEGELPAGFKRLQNAIRETLNEFKQFAGKKINFRFVDPSVAKDNKAREKFYKELAGKGIQPTQLFDKKGDEKIERIIFPGALMTYKNYEMPVILFKTIDQRIQGAPSPDQILNQSVENTEYNLISAIRQLTMKEKKKIGFTMGHGELDDKEKEDLIFALRQYYEVYNIDLPKSEVIEGVDAVIVAKPDSTFSEEDKYKLDQYIMRGGKALFFVDAVGVYMDSVLRSKGSFTFPYNHNLTDMLFKYGVRLNNDLIQDLNSGVIPLVVGNMGNQPNLKPVPWKYHPLVNSFAKHPLVKNLGAIQFKFVSSIDSIKSKGINKTPLLFSSPYTKKLATPAFITFNEARQQPDPKQYNLGAMPMAYLLEGKFSSMFKSRSFSKRKGFVAEGKESKILVCPDGDILRNDINQKKNEALPLGFDLFFRTIFSNKDFLINALDYMMDDQGVIVAKSKEITLRPLDKLKLKEERAYWQSLNLVVPVLLVIFFGAGFGLLRKWTYGKKERLKS